MSMGICEDRTQCAPCEKNANTSVGEYGPVLGHTFKGLSFNLMAY